VGQTRVPGSHGRARHCIEFSIKKTLIRRRVRCRVLRPKPGGTFSSAAPIAGHRASSEPEPELVCNRVAPASFLPRSRVRLPRKLELCFFLRREATSPPRGAAASKGSTLSHTAAAEEVTDSFPPLQSVGHSPSAWLGLCTHPTG
jgi:hypothetical protein